MKNRRRRGLEESQKKRRRFLLAVVLFINGYLFFSFFFGDMGLFKAVKMKRQYSRLQAEIASLRQENDAMAKRVEALRTDPLYIEELARGQLGMAREGELVYEFYDR